MKLSVYAFWPANDIWRTWYKKTKMPIISGSLLLINRSPLHNIFGYTNRGTVRGIYCQKFDLVSRVASFA